MISAVEMEAISATASRRLVKGSNHSRDFAVAVICVAASCVYMLCIAGGSSAIGACARQCQLGHRRNLSGGLGFLRGPPGSDPDRLRMAQCRSSIRGSLRLVPNAEPGLGRRLNAATVTRTVEAPAAGCPDFPDAEKEFRPSMGFMAQRCRRWMVPLQNNAAALETATTRTEDVVDPRARITLQFSGTSIVVVPDRTARAYSMQARRCSIRPRSVPGAKVDGRRPIALLGDAAGIPARRSRSPSAVTGWGEMSMPTRYARSTTASSAGRTSSSIRIRLSLEESYLRGHLELLIASGDRIDPEACPISALAWDNILYNSEWQHLDVWTKLLQTIVMAFVGTLFRHR